MFFQSFLVITILVVLTIAFSILYFIVVMIKKIYKTGKREKARQEISRIADLIVIYQENNKTENPQDLCKHVKIPKKMKITNENDELLIRYDDLTYSLNKGRYLE